MDRPRTAHPPWHVAHVIGQLRTGGAERQLVNYLLAADRREFRHTAVCLSGRGELADLVESAGIPVVSMPVRTRTAPVSLWRFAAWLRREQVAVVHTHMYHAALWGRLAGRLARVPVLVTTEHGKELWKSRWQVAIDHELSRITARHIVVARDGLEIRRSRERIPAAKLALIPNGVPIPADPANDPGRRRVRAEFRLDESAPVIGAVGRIVEAKGYEFLFVALATLRPRFPALKCLLAGTGELRRALERRAGELGIADMVVWAGNRGDIPDVLAAMDIWVMSSVREGLPVALLEAMAAAKPIVATAVGGIPDAARHDSEALLVPAADAEELAAAIGRLLGDRELSDRLAHTARARAVAEYGIESVARRIEAVYRQELAARSEVRG